jgi:prevent-host-death family protein
MASFPFSSRDSGGCNNRDYVAETVDELQKVSLKYHPMKTELVTTLKRQATRILKEVREEKTPVLITEHGRPSAYIVDVESFEKERERIKLLEGLARGEEAIRSGRTLKTAEARKRLKKWLK